MVSKIKFSLVFFLFFVQYITVAQSLGLIKGKVIDATTNAPLSFATIKLLNATDLKIITGQVSSETGEFEFNTPYGNYKLVIDYVGYETSTTEIIALNNNLLTLENMLLPII
jgi:hypothetical protein